MRLTAADVDAREGEFADEPDILYKRENFTPRPGLAGLPSNVVDVAKAVQNWKVRERYSQALLGAAVEPLATSLGPVVADEYFGHEAGHCLGYDVDRKYADGYFRPGGRLAWPLIYVEEFRADMLGLGLAAELLDPERASDVLLYNVLLRFGVHLEGLVKGGPAPYGSTPLLLYTSLRRVGVLGSGARGLVPLAAMSTSDRVDVMISLSDLVRTEVLSSEMECTPLEAAIGSATFHKHATTTAQADFDRFMADVLLTVEA